MSSESPPFRLIHVSDIHFWQYALNPLQLFSKRLLGMGSLLVRRARKFRLERIEQVVERVIVLKPDHVLITGDLTTTALPAEFRAARKALSPWLQDPEKTTVIPGNHDRYTIGAHRDRRFEEFFGEFAPGATYPWLRLLDSETAILGLDPTRASLTARGKLPESQLDRARELVSDSARTTRRLLIACHYPLDAPPAYRRDLASKSLVNAEGLTRWLATIGPHLYCCGHVHAAWSLVPESLPNQLCLNAGAPLLHDYTGHQPPGFLEILLMKQDVIIDRHVWRGETWEIIRLHHARSFFPAAPLSV
jgi:3',5'-cyclic AMP phosphodiesterase CpdA